MNINKVAIIGAGPSGLVSLNELLHTDKNGNSTINSFNSYENIVPENQAFEKIVVFEQSNGIGGVWNQTKEIDSKLPEITGSESKLIRPSIKSPTEDELKKFNFKNPLIRPIQSEIIKTKSMWNKSGVYDDLFTNVPGDLMRFSSSLDIKALGIEKDINPYYPFITHLQVKEYLKKYSDVNNLKSYIRLNSSVEKLYKKDNKWIIVILQIDYTNGIEKWYSEEYDAIILANGRFNIPFIPKIDNMEYFKKNNPNIISHTKSYRNINEFKDKKVLLVGTSISSIDLLQYLIPSCKEVYVSGNFKPLIKSSESNNQIVEGQWINELWNDDLLNFIKLPYIKKFTNDGLGVEFENGLIIKNFDKIIFATGYHLSYPFLNIPENKNKNYINILSAKLNTDNYAHSKTDNVYLHTFSTIDSTLGFVGIAHNSLLFLTSELNAIAIAGIWSNAKSLPSVEEQEKWCYKQSNEYKEGFTVIKENLVRDYLDLIFKYAPNKRINFKTIIKNDEVEYSRKVLQRLFYEFIDGKKQ
jgi:thioredoxin reductase